MYSKARLRANNMTADLPTLKFPKKPGDLTKNLEICANGKLQ